jgi:hypothetical protein|tara:strand:- start:60 stop:365 length:306 start_codon:yes stop_codon:yes gene_type:complete
MLPLLLFNVVSSLVIDKAQSLAKEHVEDMIDSLIPDDAKEELDAAIKADPAHEFENAKDALQGAIEGKLPIPDKNGILKPIEVNFKVTFDPTTMDIKIDKE